MADPAWRRPLDATFAAERGGRWNPPGSFPVLYLCRTPAVARANVERRFEGLPYGVLDLDPDRRPQLVATRVPPHRSVDIVTDLGCRSAGLPSSYPYDGRGARIAWARTQPLGVAAHDAGERSITCRSAALPRGASGEELAWFVRSRADALELIERRTLDDWF
ncbi:MAG TPA: RES family NAD+ phosphorylase [Actinomycetota bacterium]|nr:RES family NAD+ phosphorylase [Actinomycetota bacterium]